MTPPVLSEFTDHREYLRAFYEYKRYQTANDLRPYTYAHFSAAADIRSPNYLKLIIEGTRNLSDEMAIRFAKTIGLNKDDTQEFCSLVRYNQAKEPLERNRYLKELSDLRTQRQLRAGEISSEAWNKVPSWVTWVLYALADQKNVQFHSPEALREIIKNRASVDDIKKSLSSLLASGELVAQPETKELVKGRELMSGSEGIPVALVRKLQAELIYLGLESLFKDDPQDREFGALTVALTEEEFDQLKFELRQLRKRWFKDFAVQRRLNKGDRVFQLNIQLFPVTKQSQPTAELNDQRQEA